MMCPQPQVGPVGRDHRQFHWCPELEVTVRRAVKGWMLEDLGFEADWTSVAMVAATATGSLAVVARRRGVIAGLPAAGLVVTEADSQLAWEPLVADGDWVEPGTVVAHLAGPIRSILQVERVFLNLLGRLSGVATATRELVDAVRGTGCPIYDTRKTVPGWRLLDKYAVTCGGGSTHRLGLYDAILIKDNHLAAAAEEGMNVADAVARARGFIATSFPPERAASMVVQVEVDRLQQVEEVFAAGVANLPDIMLLDNMPTDMLRQCVSRRNLQAPNVVLEASGGITLETVGAVAATGIDRISTGMPTNAAAWLDIALDWN